jgi:hypothetical protein
VRKKRNFTLCKIGFTGEKNPHIQVVSSVADPDPRHFGKPGPDPYQSEKMDPDPHQSGKVGSGSASR